RPTSRPGQEAPGHTRQAPRPAHEDRPFGRPRRAVGEGALQHRGTEEAGRAGRREAGRGEVSGARLAPDQPSPFSSVATGDGPTPPGSSLNTWRATFTPIHT